MAVSVGDAEDEAAERTNASMLMPEMAQQLQDLPLSSSCFPQNPPPVSTKRLSGSGARRVGGGELERERG